MKRYLLFVGETCYPRGGWEDFYGEFDSVQEAQDFATNNPNFVTERHHEIGIDWAHVLDATTGKIVLRYYRRWNEATRHNEMVWGV